MQRATAFFQRYLALISLYVFTTPLMANRSSRIPQPFSTADLDKGDYASYFATVVVHYVKQFIPVIFISTILMFIGAIIWSYNRSRKDGEWGTFNSVLGFGILLVALIIGSLYILQNVTGAN